MSLLLDALKRAEQEKLAKQGGQNDKERPASAPAPAPPASAPAAPAVPRATNLELQPIKAGAQPGAARADAQNAQNMFNAKEAPASAAPRKGPLLWIALGVIVLAIIGFGGYVWYSMQAFTPHAAASNRPRPMPITPASAPADTAPQQAAQQPPKLDVIAPAQQPSVAIQPPAAAAPAPVEAPAKEKAAASPAPEQVRETVAALLRESSAPSAAPPLKLSPSREAPRVSPDVARGYRELLAGDVAAARRSYGVALDADPTNLDALLGLATIDARAGNRLLAAGRYRKVLDIDPRNATALAGLAAIAEFSQPEGAESRLRADIAANPGSAALHFTLGNLFAAQSRWNEAQVEFFEAYRLEPASADLAYNLAVSLDHLKQSRLAAEYYARALEMAREQATQFDPEAAARRLAQLKG